MHMASYIKSHSNDINFLKQLSLAGSSNTNEKTFWHKRLQNVGKRSLPTSLNTIVYVVQHYYSIASMVRLIVILGQDLGLKIRYVEINTTQCSL